MPVYAKGPGKWRVRLWHKGQRKDSIVDGTKRDALAFEARERAKLEAGDPSPVRTVPTFFDYCHGQYAQWAVVNLSPSTWNDVRVYQIKALADHFGSLRLTEIDAASVEAYKAARLRAGCVPRTVNGEVQLLRSMLRRARSLGIPAAVPEVERLRERGRPGRIKALTDAEVAALLAAAERKTPELLPLLVFLLNTGCRKTEAIRLRSDSVDLARGVIWIEPGEDWQPKNAKPREVPISPALRPWLTEERLSRTYVFPKRGGKAYRKWPEQLWLVCRDEAGIDGGPHRLRHTFATHFLRNGGDLFRLGRILGHSHARVTEIYSHVLPSDLASDAERISFSPGIGPAEAKARARWSR